jgi:SAM-dependent methyltransferase
MTEEYSYVGSELDVFNLAANWKSYYHRLVARYIGAEVLEVGAGIGATTEALSRRAPHARWVCLEPDAGLAERIEGMLGARRLPAFCQVRVGTVADLADEELFDTILYIDVLEHIEDDLRETTEAARHLKPDGHLVVLSPAHQSLYTPFDAAVGHFRRYDRRTLAAAVPKELERRELFYTDSVGALASIGNKLLLKSGTPTASQIKFWDRVLVPFSRVLDPLFGYRVGKSVIGVWRRA